MKLDLNLNNSKLDEGVWAEFDEDVSFLIRYASPKFIRSSKARHTKIKYRQGQKIEEMTKQAEKEWDAELWDHMLKDWKGVLFNGEPAKCNRENIKIVVDNLAEYSNFILDFAQSYGNFQEVEKLEVEEKNSETSSPSS